MKTIHYVVAKNKDILFLKKDLTEEALLWLIYPSYHNNNSIEKFLIELASEEGNLNVYWDERLKFVKLSDLWPDHFEDHWDYNGDVEKDAQNYLSAFFKIKNNVDVAFVKIPFRLNKKFNRIGQCCRLTSGAPARYIGEGMGLSVSAPNSFFKGTAIPPQGNEETFPLPTDREVLAHCSDEAIKQLLTFNPLR